MKSIPKLNIIELWNNQKYTNKKILIIGGFHGDEPQGVKILTEYLNLQTATSNAIFVVPCLNPEGYSKQTRTNSNNVDLNRNFPTSNWKETTKNEFYGGSAPNSEPETIFLTEIIENINPDFILTLHAPFRIVNFDGPALEISEKLAKIIGYKTQSDIGYPTPGSFGTYCGVERNIPTITLELGEDETLEWQKDKCFKIFDLLGNI